jgi:MFS family permease
MATTQFWLLFVLVCSLGWLSSIISVHLIAHIIGNGFPSMLAASIVGTMSLLRAASSTVLGSLSDRFGREAIFTVGIFFCITGLTQIPVG